MRAALIFDGIVCWFVSWPRAWGQVLWPCRRKVLGGVGLRALVPMALALMLGAGASVSAADRDLPDPAAWQLKLGAGPAEIEVIEPHLESVGPEARITYLGFPATVVLDAWLEPGWREDGYVVEFRALDGYVARIASERLRGYSAWLTFARADGSPFVVNNIAQRERDIPLGPYYLVWDNLAAPELLSEGAAQWPYQVQQILLTRADDSAVLPEGLHEDFRQEAAWARLYCLSCHQINGYGGDKMPINLAVVARNLEQEAFVAWLLQPETVRPDTTMPGLPRSLPAADRRELAQRLHHYLQALPVQD